MLSILSITFLTHDRSNFEEVGMAKKDELALVVLAVGVASILTGFGLLKVLFGIEIPGVEMVYLVIIGTFLAALGLTVLVQS